MSGLLYSPMHDISLHLPACAGAERSPFPPPTSHTPTHPHTHTPHTRARARTHAHHLRYCYHRQHLGRNLDLRQFELQELEVEIAAARGRVEFLAAQKGQVEIAPCMAARLHGCMAAWLHDCMAICRVHCYSAALLPGYTAAWLHSSMAS